MISLFVSYSLPIIVAILAMLTKSLDYKGAITGLLLAYLVVATQDVLWLILLLIFFTMGSLCTRYKEKKKKKFYGNYKIRTTRHVFANGIIPIAMSFFGSFYGFVGALSTALSDTMSSEIGVLSKRKPRMITTFKHATPGTNGAVSLLGTTIAITGTLIIGLSALLIVQSYDILWIAVISGMAGCFIDSIIGATIENNGWIGNSTTNFLATLFGAIIAIGLSML